MAKSKKSLDSIDDIFEDFDKQLNELGNNSSVNDMQEFIMKPEEIKDKNVNKSDYIDYKEDIKAKLKRKRKTIDGILRTYVGKDRENDYNFLKDEVEESAYNQASLRQNMELLQDIFFDLVNEIRNAPIKNKARLLESATRLSSEIRETIKDSMSYSEKTFGMYKKLRIELDSLENSKKREEEAAEKYYLDEETGEEQNETKSLPKKRDVPVSMTLDDILDELDSDDLESTK